MKKIILGIAVLSLLFSCKNDEKYKNILKTNFSYSDLELNNFSFLSTKISNREFYNLMSDREMKRQSYDRSKLYLDTLSKSKGNLQFNEVLFYKLKNLDTIVKGNFYFNENDKLIKSIFIKS